MMLNTGRIIQVNNDYRGFIREMVVNLLTLIFVALACWGAWSAGRCLRDWDTNSKTTIFKEVD